MAATQQYATSLRVSLALFWRLDNRKLLKRLQASLQPARRLCGLRMDYRMTAHHEYPSARRSPRRHGRIRYTCCAAWTIMFDRITPMLLPSS